MRAQQLVQPLKEPIQISGLDACVLNMLLQNEDAGVGKAEGKRD